MTGSEITDTINEVKAAYDTMIESSKKAHLDSFINFYDNSQGFLSISADGRINNYDEFKMACGKYYTSIQQQSITTKRQEFKVLDKNLVIVVWMGDIIASLKSTDTIKMMNYCITSVFKKTNGHWKVIHDHESALPAEVIK